MESKEKELSSSALRHALFTKFSQSGVLGMFKTQMRAQMVKELTVGEAANVPEQPLQLRLLNALVTDHLASHNYAYSLSVFASEACAPQDHRSGGLSRDDALQMLMLNEMPPSRAVSRFVQDALSTSEKSSSASQSSLLGVLVEYIRSVSQRGQASTGVQCDEDRRDPLSIDRKLNAVDALFHEEQCKVRDLPYKSLEERMLKYQRETNERAKEEIRREVERIRQVRCYTNALNLSLAHS
jgi:hypothetical protein